ncbi:hypothetical protein BGW37DRAFT_435821 [Umbelopsis sp. PMI_123]|nr:hypothetical protein BGW37DRAFT_435821 [Umbelopsis sp. PMI_123]
MGQLVSKEKNGSVKVALILDESSDHFAPPPEHTVNSTVSKFNFPNVHEREIHHMEALDRVAGDVEYDYETHYDSTCTYNITPTSTDYRNPKQESWRKVTFSEIVDDNDKKRVKITDIPGLKLLPTITMYSHITHMKINEAHLRFLPPEIGQLKRLETLDLGQNLLESLPTTVGTLSNLRELRLSQNKIVEFPACVPKLTKLESLLLDYNLIRQLPAELSSLVHLVQLNISGNPISVLPVEMSRLADLQKLQTDGCPIIRKIIPTSFNFPMTLQEICARTIVLKNVAIPPTTPPKLISYVSSYNTCSFCKGPYYESYVTRGMQTDRGEGQILSLEYRLCAEHWRGESSRILTMFSEAPQIIKPLNMIGTLENKQESDFSDFNRSFSMEFANETKQENQTAARLAVTLPARRKNLWRSISHLRKHQQPQELSPTMTSRQLIDNGWQSLNCRIPTSVLENKTNTPPSPARSLMEPVH